MAVKFTDALLLNSLPLIPQATPAVLLPPPEGGAVGVSDTAADASELPTALSATTEQAYVWPLLRPVTGAGLVAVVAEILAGPAVQLAR